MIQKHDEEKAGCLTQLSQSAINSNLDNLIGKTGDTRECPNLQYESEKGDHDIRIGFVGNPTIQDWCRESSTEGLEDRLGHGYMVMQMNRHQNHQSMQFEYSSLVRFDINKDQEANQQQDTHNKRKESAYDLITSMKSFPNLPPFRDFQAIISEKS